MAGFLSMAPATPVLAAGFLGANTILSFIKGYNLTAAVGGADMRKDCCVLFNCVIVTDLSLFDAAVVITVLNAYSGFALVAEGTSTRHTITRH
jgi:NAD(P) transhydrogenase